MRIAQLLVGSIALSFVGLIGALDNRLNTRKKTLKKNIRGLNSNARGIRNAKNNEIIEEEDLAFWTGLLVGDKGKGRHLQSMPLETSPPTTPPAVQPPETTPNPTDPTVTTPNPTEPTGATPNPTDPTIGSTPNPIDVGVMTPFPTQLVEAPTPPSPTPGGIQCPDVQCTAPDPLNPVDECELIGEPCPDGNEGEFCCLDGCPRKYCTAKVMPVRA